MVNWLTGDENVKQEEDMSDIGAVEDIFEPVLKDFDQAMLAHVGSIISAPCIQYWNSW